MYQGLIHPPRFMSLFFFFAIVIKRQLALKIGLVCISDIINMQSFNIFLPHVCSIVHFTANVVKQITLAHRMEEK